MIDGNFIVFDTETISLEKKYIYNVGYTITNPDGKILVARDYIIKQVYDNKVLFSTAYYAQKRPKIVHNLRARRSKRVSWGEMCRLMLKDIKDYNITDGFAFNSKFDIEAFYFNHLLYKNKRKPLDGLKLHDIMDYIYPITETDSYKNFCKLNKFITKNGRPRRNVETIYAFLHNDTNFTEEHLGLSDSIIETEILLRSLALGN